MKNSRCGITKCCARVLFTSSGHCCSFTGPDFDFRQSTPGKQLRPLLNIEDIGRCQHSKYLKDVLHDGTESIDNPIKNNSLSLFKRQKPKEVSKLSSKMSVLKSYCNWFSRLYIANQHREGDLDEFFKYENQPYPPSLSEFGKIRFGAKSDLLQCIEEGLESAQDYLVSFDGKGFYGAVIVHALPVVSATTFDEYADNIFLPYVNQQSCENIN